jgi:hypothetical protein
MLPITPGLKPWQFHQLSTMLEAHFKRSGDRVAVLFPTGDKP